MADMFEEVMRNRRRTQDSDFALLKSYPGQLPTTQIPSSAQGDQEHSLTQASPVQEPQTPPPVQSQEPEPAPSEELKGESGQAAPDSTVVSKLSPKSVRRPPPQEPLDEESDLEYGYGGSSTGTADSETDSTRKPVRKKPYGPSKDNTQPDMRLAHVQALPAKLVTMARALFPEASTNTDAVAACLARWLGDDTCLNDKAKMALRSYCGDDPLVSVNTRMIALEAEVRELTAMMARIELLTAYTLFDRLGFRKSSTTEASRVDMTEPGVSDIMKRASECLHQLKSQESARSGRTYWQINNRQPNNRR